MISASSAHSAELKTAVEHLSRTTASFSDYLMKFSMQYYITVYMCVLLCCIYSVFSRDNFMSKSTAEGDIWKEIILENSSDVMTLRQYVQVVSGRYGEINKHFCQEL